MIQTVVLGVAGTICILGGLYLGYKDRDGWGWVIFAGLLILGWIQYSK